MNDNGHTMEQQHSFWSYAVEFLNQNDLLSLGRTNKHLYELALKKVYQKIVIAKNPVLRSQEWFLDCGTTYLAGYRSVRKTGDQNDIFLYDRIVRLAESPHLNLVRELVIQEDVFEDKEVGLEILGKLVQKLISLDRLEVLDIRDSQLFLEVHSQYLQLSNLRQCQVVNISELNNLRSIDKMKSLKVLLTSPDFDRHSLKPAVKTALFLNLEELVVEDLEHSSLRLFQYFHDERLFLTNVKYLKFNHVHGIHDYNKTMRELIPDFLASVFHLEKLERLEFEGSCEVEDCPCYQEFLMDLAPRLCILRELGLIEKTFITQGDHYTEENWDLAINKFIYHLPNVSNTLQKLAIRHNPPSNGIQKDSVEGNYTRRRTLYDNVLPKLTSLKTLVTPTFLRSLCSYEVLVCDLLWNGCECDYCDKVLPIIDQFIMNHQFYSSNDACYKDIIPTVFFAFAGDALSRRFITETDWDVKSWTTCPVSHYWDMHGYENVHHFQDYVCRFDESVYDALTKCVAHFLNSYMDHLVRYLPQMRSCILSGVYYAVNDANIYKSIYD
ncbi:LAME_0E02256g1_1 [Lachancea meyersii CBS 8951]|uniref:LAME_0E02256g1_1 n=1 Tax=Lachancea meyersii CBS 8951 TaxID=1266667 RepID=A0A1G4JFP9_9SACH|nr:LAME_0E02256g1_1 [Lachancea meyersii CBS 8951]